VKRRLVAAVLVIAVVGVVLMLDAVSGEVTGSPRFPLLKVALGHGYYRGPIAVYHRHRMEDADATVLIVLLPRHFQLVGDGFARDSKHVWCNGWTVPLDPSTLQSLGDGFVRDRKVLWRACRPQLVMRGRVATPFDMTSLQALGCNFLRDRNGVYVAGQRSLLNGERAIDFAVPMDEADAASFHRLDPDDCVFADKRYTFRLQRP
jgi:hypothetical protein